ncbi:hypothetical protein AM1_3179 [Acaryochloris marina MBIC11017]|uniref:Uncharacterized protein n=1 Tax=Acaryochloris marina (strain MBIC 11017) TaxID=329726 RepID=B0CES1_ACAM1|nr:hypothetical protein AM1_3179 [Acaryochloris marina MBIC11017]
MRYYPHTLRREIDGLVSLLKDRVGIRILPVYGMKTTHQHCQQMEYAAGSEPAANLLRG